MIKPLLLLLLMFSLFSCFSKKTPPKNIGSWLELHFPGQFDVLDSNLKMLDVMAQFRGEKQALVADKADPEVQFLMDWLKGTDSLGLDTAELRKAHERAKTLVAQGRALFSLLAANGLEKFSVGVIEQSAYIQVFAEPIPAVREQTLAKVKVTLDARPEQPQTSIFIELMEPAAYGAQYQDLIPRGHWLTSMGWQKEQQLMALDFEWGKNLDLPTMMRHWEASSESKRSSGYQDEAYRDAQAWAEKNLPKPFFLSDHLVGVETPESDRPAIRYGFPYYDQKPPEESSYNDPEPKGYVCGLYEVDKQVFSKIRKQKEW